MPLVWGPHCEERGSSLAKWFSGLALISHTGEGLKICQIPKLCPKPVKSGAQSVTLALGCSCVALTYLEQRVPVGGLLPGCSPKSPDTARGWNNSDFLNKIWKLSHKLGLTVVKDFPSYKGHKGLFQTLWLFWQNACRPHQLLYNLFCTHTFTIQRCTSLKA